MSKPASRLRATASFLLRYAVGAALIWWLVRTDALDFGAFGDMTGALIAQGLLLGLAIVALTALRIQYLLRDQGIHVGFRRCYVYNCIGLFYSLFLPGGISGDAARIYYFLRHAQHRRTALVGALLLDRFLGLITMIGLGLVSGLLLLSVLEWIAPYIAGFSAAMLLLVLGLVVALRYEIRHEHDPGAHRLVRYWNALKGVFARLHLRDYSARTLALSLFLSAFMNGLSILLIYLCSNLNQSGLGLIEVSAATPLGLLTNAIPLSPGGLGVGEKSFDVLYRALGGANGAGSFLAARLFIYSPAVLGGLFAAYFLLLHRAARAAPSEAKR